MNFKLMRFSVPAKIILFLCVSFFLLETIPACKRDTLDTVTPPPPPPSSDSITLSFETNGGTPIPPQRIKKGEKPVLPVSTSLDKFVFAGWYTDKLLTVPYDISAPVSTDLTIFAKWSLEGGLRIKKGNVFSTIKDYDFTVKLNGKEIRNVKAHTADTILYTDRYKAATADDMIQVDVTAYKYRKKFDNTNNDNKDIRIAVGSQSFSFKANTKDTFITLEHFLMARFYGDIDFTELVKREPNNLDNYGSFVLFGYAGISGGYNNDRYFQMSNGNGQLIPPDKWSDYDKKNRTNPLYNNMPYDDDKAVFSFSLPNAGTNGHQFQCHANYYGQKLSLRMEIQNPVSGSVYSEVSANPSEYEGDTLRVKFIFK